MFVNYGQSNQCVCSYMRYSVGDWWWKLVAINVKHLMCIKPDSIVIEGVRGGTTGISNRQVKY